MWAEERDIYFGLVYQVIYLKNCDMGGNRRNIMVLNQNKSNYNSPLKASFLLWVIEILVVNKLIDSVWVAKFY